MALVCRIADCSYTKTHGPITGLALQYCPDCGRRMETVPIQGSEQIQQTSRWARFGGFLLDALILTPFALLISFFIPGIGPIFAVCFWLFRDMNGSSIGKAIVGTVVVSRDGRRARAMQRVVRNLPFAVPLLPMFVPFIGTAPAEGLQALVISVEIIAVFITGERLGGKLANTMVVKKSALPAIQRSMGSIEI